MSARTTNICDTLLWLAKHHGAEAVASVRESRTGHVRFAASEITTSGEVSATSAHLSLAFGRRHAAAESNQASDHALQQLFDRCATLAKIAPEDPEYMPPVGIQHHPPNHQAWDDGASALSPASRAAWARAPIDTANGKGFIASGFCESDVHETTLADSRDLHAAHQATEVSLTTTMRTADGKGSGWAGAAATRASDIDAASLAAVAADKAARSHDVTRLDPGRYTVILEPAAVADLLGFLVDALDARAADQGRSYFSHAPEGIDPRLLLRSDPFDPSTPGCPWDAEGLPLHKTTWIGDGRVQTLRTTRFWAQKTGKHPSGAHETFELSCPAGASSPSALLSGVKRGLLVTRFWYTRWLEPKRLLITGLTRDGVWLIEDGKPSRPVNNFRFNASPITMFTRLVDATRGTWRVPSWSSIVRAPVLCCDDFEMASVSDAI